MRCPICDKEVKADSPLRPFCSDRCKLVDLGRWFNGAYAIPTEEAPDDENAGGQGDHENDA